MPTLSVILPTYNRAAVIEDALQSILKQTRPANEIIVVDDGSDDNTSSILVKYHDRIKIITQNNAGVSIARNIGISHATGDWLTFLDSDDLWYPDRLSILERDIKAAPSTVGVHLANARFTGANFDWDLFAIKRLSFPVGAAEIVSSPLRFVIGGGAMITLACRRDWADKVGGFDPHARIAEDTDFASRLALLGPWAITQDIVADARRLDQGEDGLRRQADRAPLWRYEVELMLKEKLMSMDMSKSDRRIASLHLSMALFAMAQAYYEAGNRKAARTFLLRAAAVHPRVLRGALKSLIPLVFGRNGFDGIDKNRKIYRRG
jgi:glycosyltransferase involved in cell wall biosynthesis